jgi:hypothetical protein
MIGVVFVSYKIPLTRLYDHYYWNMRRADYYNSTTTLVFPVLAEQVAVPDGSHAVEVAEEELPLCGGKRIFSLSLTKNRGIETALRAGCDPIIVTDVDCTWPQETWSRMIRVDDNRAVVPVYLMADSFESREQATHEDHGMTGTIAMRARWWQRCRYDERCFGYGAEDGVMMRAIREYGRLVNRNCHVWHIAHDQAAPQVNVPGKGRSDCWNRDTINPDNFEYNKQFCK